MDATVRKIRYIRDVPVELTKEAIERGELKKGMIVGLDVNFVGQTSDTLIELKLTKEGQEILVREGAVIPVDATESLFYMDEHWKDMF